MAAGTIGTLVSCTLVAYSFSRFRYHGRDLMFVLTLGTVMLPAEVTLVPRYLIFRELGWLDTLSVLLKGEQSGAQFYLAGVASIALGLFSLTLPNTPPKKTGKSTLQLRIQVRGYPPTTSSKYSTRFLRRVNMEMAWDYHSSKKSSRPMAAQSWPSRRNSR